MTGGAFHARRPEIIRAASDRRAVRVHVVALERPIGARMAIDAARALDDLVHFAEQRDRTRILIGNAGKSGRILERDGRIPCHDGDGQRDDRNRQGEKARVHAFSP